MFSIYKGKRVLVTGHTGFKGSWLSAWLKQLGAEVIGLSNEVPTKPSNYEVSKIDGFVKDHRIDICDTSAVREVILEEKPDFIFHLAAQALVRPSYEEPVATMQVNAIGSANILDALRHVKKHTTVLMITSDKAYDNVEWVWGYRETDKLGGKDPYSASKGMAEMAIRSFIESYFNNADSLVRVGITRAGNVIGGGDWAVDRIVPDCMRAWAKGQTVDVRSPDATRPWQHVLEPLSGYLCLGARLHQEQQFHGEAYNFGPAAHNNQSVSELIDVMATHWDNVKWNDTSGNENKFHEAGLLKLNCDKSLLNLKWQPALEFSDTVRMTVQWYRGYYQEKADMEELTTKQILEYTDIAKAKGSIWTKPA